MCVSLDTHLGADLRTHHPFQTCLDALAFLRDVLHSSRADEFRAACDVKFTLSTVFNTESELAAIRRSHLFGIGEDLSDERGKIEEQDFAA